MSLSCYLSKLVTIPTRNCCYPKPTPEYET
jgi:hypothetical protein